MKRWLLLLMVPGQLALAAEPVPLPSNTGQTGLIAMPDARMAPDGTWRTGYSFDRPYHSFWSSLTAMPWAEGSFRFVRIQYAPQPFLGRPDADYGDYRDKAFDGKLRLLPERGWMPQVSLGAQDVGGGTGLFAAYYGVASKRLGDFDFTLGYGAERIDGVFGGVRWQPSQFPNWSLAAEYDANDYPNDRFSDSTGLVNRKKGAALALEYHRESWGAKLFGSHDDIGANVWVSVPLQAKEFVPKINEPAPYTKIVPRPSEAQWQEDAAHEARLRRALIEQGYEDVTTRYEHGRLEATVSNARISSMPRAVGRAARTLLAFAPLEVRELRITYVQPPVPFATYTFADAKLLQKYFNGLATRQALAETVALEYAGPAGEASDEAREQAIAAAAEPLPESIVLVQDEVPQYFSYQKPVGGGLFRIRPSLAAYFNDPSGAIKLDLSALFSWDARVAPQSYVNTEIKGTIWENVSDVTQPSNSLLPHVRTDVARYKAGDEVKLLKAMFNQFYQPATRLYARASAGIYEEMYAGAGGQLLYLAPGGGWAADLAVDALRQRDYTGWFGFLDYSTVTAVASLHYRMAHGLTATLRAGRFLAQDEGVRVEMKRRFASGFEVGAWYTITNGDDITSPGSPESPYYDKGIFMQMAINSMLTRDTRSTATMALSPWTRDVGQMVVSPGDLARLMERNVFDRHDLDGLRRFGDMEDDYHLPELGGEPWPDWALANARDIGSGAAQTSWVEGLAIGAGLVLGSALLDKPVDDWAVKNQDKKALQRAVKWGDALPLAALGVSGLLALDDSRPRLNDAAIAALEAGALAALGTEVFKRAVGRARPDAGLGATEFDPMTSEDSHHSFPSRSAAVMWAAVTPYAKEYDQPWLYGLAAFTSAARAASREHWVSDTVAGSLLGYWLGSIAWDVRREGRLRKNEARIAMGLDGVTLTWDFR